MNTNNGKPVLSVRLQLAAEMLKALIMEPISGNESYMSIFVCNEDSTVKDNLKDVGAAQRMAYAAYALADALIEYEQKEKVE